MRRKTDDRIREIRRKTKTKEEVLLNAACPSACISSLLHQHSTKSISLVLSLQAKTRRLLLLPDFRRGFSFFPRVSPFFGLSPRPLEETASLPFSPCCPLRPDLYPSKRNDPVMQSERRFKGRRRELIACFSARESVHPLLASIFTFLCFQQGSIAAHLDGHNGNPCINSRTLNHNNELGMAELRDS